MTKFIEQYLAAAQHLIRTPEWIRALKPDKTVEGDDWAAYTWLGEDIDGDILIEVYDDGEVMAMAPNPDGKGRGICEVRISDREWIENFSRHGWADTNPSFNG